MTGSQTHSPQTPNPDWVSLGAWLSSRGPLSAYEIAVLSLSIAQAVATVQKSKGKPMRFLALDSILMQKGDNRDFSVSISESAIAELLETKLEDLAADQERVVRYAPYLSPEQCSGEEPDFRSDVYSLGCLMYQLACGVPPLQGKTAYETLLMQVHNKPLPFEQKDAPGNLPDEMETIVFKAMEKNPEKRFPDASSLCSALLSVDTSSCQTAMERLQAHINKRLTATGKSTLFAVVISLSLFAVTFFLANNTVSIPVLLGFQNQIKKSQQMSELFGAGLTLHIAGLYLKKGSYTQAYDLLSEFKESGKASREQSLEATLMCAELLATHPNLMDPGKLCMAVKSQLELALKLKSDPSMEEVRKKLATSATRVILTMPALVESGRSDRACIIAAICDSTRRLYQLEEYESAVSSLSALLSLKNLIRFEDFNQYAESLAELAGYARATRDTITSSRAMDVVNETIRRLPDDQRMAALNHLMLYFCNPSTTAATRAALFDTVVRCKPADGFTPPVRFKSFALYTLYYYVLNKEFTLAEASASKLKDMGVVFEWEAYKSMALAAVEAGENNRARSYYQRSLDCLELLTHLSSGALSPQSYMLNRVVLAEVKVEQGEGSEVKDLLLGALDPVRGLQKGRKRKALAHYLLGRIEFEEGNYRKAREDYEKALNLGKGRNPFHHRYKVLKHLAICLEKLGEKEKAASVREDAEKATADEKAYEGFDSAGTSENN